jgi:hypothetical protein
MGSQDHHADACFFDPQSTVRQSAASSHPGPSCSAAQSIQPLGLVNWIVNTEYNPFDLLKWIPCQNAG